MSGGYTEEGFAALLTVITEANEKGDWPGFVTPNFTTGTAIYARLFREVFFGTTRRGLDYWERARPNLKLRQRVRTGRHAPQHKQRRRQSLLLRRL